MNHGIVSFDGVDVLVNGRLCERFACMLQLVTKVFVVTDFGVRGRRTDRSANGLLGSTAVAWDMGLSVGQATLVRQRSLFSACVKLMDMDELTAALWAQRAAEKTRIDRRAQVVGELLMENVYNKNMLFQTCWVKFLPIFRCDTSRPIHGLERWARMV